MVMKVVPLSALRLVTTVPAVVLGRWIRLTKVTVVDIEPHVVVLGY